MSSQKEGEGGSTHWSRIEAGDYEHVIRRYWQPVHRFLARRLGSSEDAEEVTQDLFLAFLERDLLSRARPGAGGFRHFLYHVAQGFLVDRYRARGAAKRGAGRVVSLEARGADEEYRGPTPPEEFDGEWYTCLLADARRRLRGYYEEQDRPEGYLVFRLFHFGDDDAPDRLGHVEIAERLRMTVGQVRNLLHRAKNRYLDLVRELLAESCAPGEGIEEEMATLARFLERHRLQGAGPSTLFEVGGPEAGGPAI